MKDKSEASNVVEPNEQNLLDEFESASNEDTDREYAETMINEEE